MLSAPIIIVPMAIMNLIQVICIAFASRQFPYILHIFAYFSSRYLLVIIITPHVSDVSGVIVLTSCVCLSVSLSQPNRRTYRLEFWHGGQVEGYLGQGHRSRSQGQKMFIGMFHLTFDSLVYGHAKEDTQEYDWPEYDVGCFQSICVFFCSIGP